MATDCAWANDRVISVHAKCVSDFVGDFQWNVIDAYDLSYGESQQHTLDTSIKRQSIKYVLFSESQRFDESDGAKDTVLVCLHGFA